MMLMKDQIIDVSIGEGHVIKDSLIKTFDLDGFRFTFDDKIFEYQKPAGYEPLVKILEDKYQSPVIITSGAKQALSACFYSLVKMNNHFLSIRKPYWSLLQPLCDMHGLVPDFYDDGIGSYNSPLLLVNPNNPDGSFIDDVSELSNNLMDKKSILIHDAVYYSHVYINRAHELKSSVGDAQIFSFSKMYGLSSLRLGYVVCKNKEMYKHILEYIEGTTSGVSITSQVFAYDLVKLVNDRPDLNKDFEDASYQAILANKKLAKQINSNIISVDSKIESTSGMFLWAKLNDPSAFIKAKINVAYGDLFGDKDFIRMNLAIQKIDMEQIVFRLNNLR